MIKNQQQQTFTKAYTRDFSIIMQQIWFAVNTENLIKKLGFQKHPYSPPYLYYMKDGVEEVWQNIQAYHWLLKQLIKKTTDNKFFPEICQKYFEQLTEIKLWRKKDIKNILELKKFIDKIYESMSDFVVIYELLTAEAVPEKYQKNACQFREQDMLFAECNAAIRRALMKTYPKFGYLAVYITLEELGKKISIKELQKRDKGFALIPNIYRGTISFENLIKKFPEYHFVIEKRGQKKNNFKGQIAYPGKVLGKVRIVKRADQAKKVIGGEIIVSPMTTPDFISAMKKAAAFITDEGGVTCHAAIIAREIKKPCLIGTKIATQLLKDGDIVEVDAITGIIRIIK